MSYSYKPGANLLANGYLHLVILGINVWPGCAFYRPRNHSGRV
jgi:hypothetical protein